MREKTLYDCFSAIKTTQNMDQRIPDQSEPLQTTIYRLTFAGSWWENL